MRSVPELLKKLNASTANEVVVRHLRGGVGSSLAAAQAQAEANARDPWAAGSGTVRTAVEEQEYVSLKEAGALDADLLGKNVIASWIWSALTPQIDYCRYALGTLAIWLSFRASTGHLERLRTLRDVLLPEGRDVFDDMVGELDDYRKAARAHDEALQDLADKASERFASLRSQREFRRIVVEPRTEAGEAVELPPSENLSRWTDHLAANVVNDRPVPSDDGELTQIWNAVGEKLKAVDEPTGRELAKSRKEFERVVRETLVVLERLRRSWSRQFDVPVAAVPGLRLEATSR